jgi:uncharacterized protein YerC
MKGKKTTLQQRITIAKKFIAGYSVKELAAKYGVVDSTIAGYLRTHINKHGKVVSTPPYQSKQLQLPGEIWKKVPIPSASLYEASNRGRIRSHTWGYPKIVAGNVKYGYRSVDFKLKEGGRRSEFAHVLVAYAWHGRRPPGNYCIAHLDYDSWNNEPVNLRWMTKREAQRHSRNSPYMEMLKKRVLNMPDAKKRNARYGKLSRKEVMSIKQKLHNGRKTIDVANEYNIAENTVARIHRGLIWSDVLPQLTRKKKELKIVPTDTRIIIISQIKAGMYAKDIAALHGVDPTTVGRIKKSLNHTT